MRKHIPVPGSHTLMPIIIKILDDNGGKLSSRQVLYMVMFQRDFPIAALKRVYNEVKFSAVYLRRIGALKGTDVTKKGNWELTDDFKNLSFEDAKRISYEKYDVSIEENRQKGYKNFK